MLEGPLYDDISWLEHCYTICWDKNEKVKRMFLLHLLDKILGSVNLPAINKPYYSLSLG
jgi:hypothetical protein